MLNAFSPAYYAQTYAKIIGASLTTALLLRLKPIMPPLDLVLQLTVCLADGEGVAIVLHLDLCPNSEGLSTEENGWSNRFWIIMPLVQCVVLKPLIISSQMSLLSKHKLCMMGQC